MIVFSLAGALEYAFKKDLILTSVYRKEEGSVHEFYRGVDFRICPKGQKPIYTDDEIKYIKEICKHFVYEDHPTLLIHDAGTGLHGHLQVDEKETKMR